MLLQVQTAKIGSAARWRSVEDYLAAETSQELELVIAVTLPPVKPGEEFWSYKACTSTIYLCASL